MTYLPLMQSISYSDESFRAYRAPSANGTALIDPPLSQARSLTDTNRQLTWTDDSWWASLRTIARERLLVDSIRYTGAYRSTAWIDELCRGRSLGEMPILMAGHQPELFHAGVWFKNFALHQLSQSLAAIPVNVVVDNDVAMRRSIRVPRLDPSTGDTTGCLIAYDEGAAGIPYEQLVVQNIQTFDGFDQDVARVLSTLVKDPCVVPLWNHARAALRRCAVAGCALAQARHAFEENLGLKTIEIPLSVAVRSIAFAKFLLAILGELPRFQKCYNRSASLYRTAHGIRSSAHPVPNLAKVDDWFEAPLWIYGDDSPVRRAAWIRNRDGSLIISDRNGRECIIERPGTDAAAECLAHAQCSNWKIRPRALLTTMYLRLVLSDLFLHGIGGGKYDQLGDAISQSFFEITPPQFMVMSATVRLPGIELTHDAELTKAELLRDLRNTLYSAERFAELAPIDPALIHRKSELLSSIPPHGQKAAWHREIKRVNAAMSDSLSDVREELRDRLRRTEKQLASQSLLASREHSFCLFPQEYLCQTYERLLS